MDESNSHESDDRAQRREGASGTPAREIHRLCDGLFDDLVDDAQFSRLNRLLRASAAARGLYLRYVRLHARLTETAGVCERAPVADLKNVAASVALARELQRELVAPGTLAVESGRIGRRRRALKWAAWAVAASVLLGSATLLFHDGADVSRSAPPERTMANSSAPADPDVRIRIVKADGVDGTAGSGISLAAGETLTVGARIDLAAGEAELLYPTGVRLTLVAPAEFHLHAAGGLLVRGGLLASVTEAGHGFTIETPTGKVVDLGTEFGVAVDDFGVSEVNVFRGKVEAFPQAGDPKVEKFELSQGRGLQWTRDSIIPLNADIRRFTSLGVGKRFTDAHANAFDAAPRTLRPVSLGAGKWRPLGAARVEPGGLVLRGGPGGERAYAIGHRRLDPSDGPVHVVCEFEADADALASGSVFAIVTRAVGRRGVAGSPSAELLATGVRGSIASDSGSGDGVLETGVKLEPDREASKVAWHGLGRIEPNARYRAEITDDGVTVTLRVSRIGAAGVSKTVSCRSLFRGEDNVIALEGPAAGQVTVSGAASWQTAAHGELVDADPVDATDGAEARRAEDLFNRWTPPGAELLLSDSFDSSDIPNEARWVTLGDVRIADGAASLGRPNRDQHIDTWHARPYLLTRESFDPTQTPLVVTGRIRFSENFLRGYGASFAVMTRASDRRGAGPGWEYSVLTTGVRVNFWPAAWDLQHSLEIHQKPSTNTISLLATKALPVDSDARDYAFCATDDGRQVGLTIVDLSRPELTATIRSATNVELGAGRIGFESSWGSPVLLDDVRVYRTSSATTRDAEGSDRAAE